eukprot:2258218-Amphidinium_carterae.2
MWSKVVESDLASECGRASLEPAAVPVQTSAGRMQQELRARRQSYVHSLIGDGCVESSGTPKGRRSGWPC